MNLREYKEYEDWRELKAYIEWEIEKNWLEEPSEMKKLRNGIVTTGAGSFNQYLSTMMFINVYTIAFGQHMFFMFVQLCDDPEVSLEILKKMTDNEIMKGFQPTQFLAHVSTPEVHEMALNIVKVLPQINTKDEYRELMGAYVRYINLLHYWHHCTFPWHLGLLYQYKTVEEINEMYQLVNV